MTTPNSILHLCQPFIGSKQGKPGGLPLYAMLNTEHGEPELRKGRRSSESGLRLALGVSTKEFSEKMGFSMNYSRQLLAPKRKLTPEMAISIAKTFEVPERLVFEAQK